MASDGYSVAVLVVSDTVSRGEKEDLSGKNLETILKKAQHFPVSDVHYFCVADEVEEVTQMITQWTDDLKVDLILTVGGTGFSPRDVTPEATKTVIEKEASHIASFMIMCCAAKKKFAILSRSVCGIRGSSLILNLPGSKKGSEECFEAVASVLPHAMDQLRGDAAKVASKHSEVDCQII